MQHLIFLLLYVFSLCSCAIAQVGHKVIESKDANGIVYQKVFYSPSNTLDSILYIKVSGESVLVNNNIKEQAKPKIKDTIDDFIENNLIYPPNFDQQGKVILLLFIDKRGNNSEIRVLNTIPKCDLCATNAIEAIKKIGEWLPALNNFDNSIDCILPVTVKFK
jgi:Gram-negative bacterial TonB protein C-terminal